VTVFFSSVMLAEELLQQGVFLTGTVKKNSKFFPALSSVSTRGAYQWKMQENGVLAGVWKDNKEVYFISTASPPTKDPMPTCKRRIQNKLELPQQSKIITRQSLVWILPIKDALIGRLSFVN